MWFPIHSLPANKIDFLVTFDFILRIMTKNLSNEKQRRELEAKLSNLAYVTYSRPLNHAMKKRKILK